MPKSSLSDVKNNDFFSLLLVCGHTVLDTSFLIGLIASGDYQRTKCASVSLCVRMTKKIDSLKSKQTNYHFEIQS